MKNKIAIHSAPRSGSTWLGSIMDSSPNVAYRYQPLFSYKFKGWLTDTSSDERIDEFFNLILNSTDPFINQKEQKEKGLIPMFKKDNVTHIVYKEVRYHNILENMLENDSEVKLICLIRNPYAVINSWLKAPQEFKAELGWEELEEWKFAHKKNRNRPEEFNGFIKWLECAKLFNNLNQNFSDRVMLIKYKELLEHPLETAGKIFKFCNLNLTSQTVDFIKISQSNHNTNAYSVFKKKNGDDVWKQELNPLIQTEIKNILKSAGLRESLWK